MKPVQYYIVVTLAAISLVLSIALIALGKSNQGLQADLQKQQEEINKGNMSQQIGTNIVRDMAQAAVKNEKVRQVLTQNGFTLQQNPEAGAGALAPAAAPTATP